VVSQFLLIGRKYFGKHVFWEARISESPVFQKAQYFRKPRISESNVFQKATWKRPCGNGQRARLADTPKADLRYSQAIAIGVKYRSQK